jgi:hypothetical protein
MAVFAGFRIHYIMVLKGGGFPKISSIRLPLLWLKNQAWKDHVMAIFARPGMRFAGYQLDDLVKMPYQAKPAVGTGSSIGRAGLCVIRLGEAEDFA